MSTPSKQGVMARLREWASADWQGVAKIASSVSFVLFLVAAFVGMVTANIALLITCGLLLLPIVTLLLVCFG